MSLPCRKPSARRPSFVVMIRDWVSRKSSGTFGHHSWNSSSLRPSGTLNTWAFSSQTAPHSSAKSRSASGTSSSRLRTRSVTSKRPTRLAALPSELAAQAARPVQNV
ncbi:hypothetical protein G6F57_022456 [Rhizopus arrhizus]|nr:hypothetical protein G6F57_022456 [Rhizopus arrhizus]